MFNISEQVRGEIGLKFRLAQNSVCNKDIQKTANNKDTLFVSMYKKLQSSKKYHWLVAGFLWTSVSW